MERTWGSRTTSRRAITLGPPARFWRILISRLIFFFLTGLSTLMTHLSFETVLTPSNTSEYCTSQVRTTFSAGRTPLDPQLPRHPLELLPCTDTPPSSFPGQHVDHPSTRRLPRARRPPRDPVQHAPSAYLTALCYPPLSAAQSSPALPTSETSQTTELTRRLLAPPPPHPRRPPPQIYHLNSPCPSQPSSRPRNCPAPPTRPSTRRSPTTSCQTCRSRLGRYALATCLVSLLPRSSWVVSWRGGER